ncbi:hypothetical protein OAW64_00600 [Flavobacteriales bacterium]|jgi:hypothetical protein|nr:hypothetical protein [Flavobacteriales bacterium]
MRKLFIVKYSIIVILILNFNSCKILKKNKKCDCPEWTYHTDLKANDSKNKPELKYIS